MTYIIEVVQPGMNDEVYVADNRTCIQQFLTEQYGMWFEEADKKVFAAVRPEWRDMILNPTKQYVFFVGTATYSILNYRPGRRVSQECMIFADMSDAIADQEYNVTKPEWLGVGHDPSGNQY